MFEMKDSGIEWLGEIPSHWNLTKISTVYDERNTKVSDKEFMPLSVTKKGILPQLETAAKTDNGDNRKLILKGDFVINSRSDRRGSCGISSYNGSCSLINTVLIPRQKMCNEFYNFVFKTERFAEEFYRWGHGIVDDLWSTKWSDMKNIYIPLPPLDEQKKIADFLDKKCSAIDSALDTAKKLVEKFREYKKSLITETVTKGLNPAAELVDSNIEWLGLIPSHWKICRLKYFVYLRARLGWKGLKADEYVMEGYPLLSALNITNDKLNFKNLNFVNQDRYDESPEIKLTIGDILLVKDGAGIGKCALVNNLPTESTVNGSILVLTPLKNFLSDYLYYFFLSDSFQFRINQIKEGMGVPHLFQSDMKNFKISLPPLNEQKKIADFLDKKCSAIDEKISKREKLIEKLTEYKKSLIYEAVTGKLEV